MIVALFFSSSAAAQSTGALADPAKTAIRLVTEASPYVYVQGGKVAGPATEILVRALEDAGMTFYDIGIYPWARAYDLALTQPHVLIYLIARTPERETRFKWVAEMLRIDFDFYRLKSRQDIRVQSLADARAYRVGVVRDDVRHQYFQQQGFQKLLVEAQSIDNFRQLLNQRVDLLALTEPDVVGHCKQEQFDCAQLERVYRLENLAIPLYAAFSLSTPDETVRRLQRSFDSLKAKGKAKL